MTKYHWYRANQNIYPRPILPDVKFAGNHFGYKEEPPYEHIEKFDLRLEDICTIDELFDKYFQRS